jgi:uncharacterized protein YqeY
MSLLQQLTDDMKAALKAGEKDRLQVIRMVLSDVKNRDLMPSKPSELQIVESYHKKLKKSLEEYQKLGKDTEVKSLLFEIGVVEHYLPKKLGEPETAALVDQFLSGQTFTEKDTGKATGMFMKAHGSDVDAATASKLVREKLTGK